MVEFSVKKPFTVFVGVILIIVLGVMSYMNMTADLLPKIDLPYMIVTTTYVGATPEKVETVVTKPLEQVLGTVTNLKNINSVSSENYSMIILEFSEGTNMDSTLVDLNNKLSTVKEVWTDEMIGNPTITKIDTNSLPVVVAAIDVQGLQDAELTEYVNKNIINNLEKIEGVAAVTATGAIEENITISLNQEKIDKINEKIIASVDSELAKSASQISSAKSQIASGKEQLNNTKTEKTKEIDEGISQITNGKIEINNGIETLNKEKTKLETIKAVIQQVIGLLDKGEDPIEILLSYGNQLQLDIEKLRNMGSDLENNIRTQLEEMLLQMESGLNQIDSQGNTLKAKYEELNLQQIQASVAKNTLETQLNQTQKELELKEKELETATSELEVAKDKAYKSASLEGAITQDVIAKILSAQNFSMPAGYIQSDDKNIVVKVGEEISSIDELKELTLFSLDIKGLENITLEDVADIEMLNNSADIYAKVNGNNAVVVSLQKESIASTKNVADSIKTAFSELEQNNNQIKFTVLLDQGIYIDLVVDSVLNNLLYGAILAIIILFIFLKDYRPTLAIALSIPISLTFAIVLMYFTGVTINVVSLAGLALSVGMLVDNAIVVIENIYRLKNEGLSTKEAAIKGAKTVSGAIIASTLTTICVFFPIVFIEGITRQLFVDMALTIAYSLIASLIVALTVVPTITSKLFDRQIKPKEDIVFPKFINIYEKILKGALKHKAIVLSSALILLVGSGLLINVMGTAFIPEMEGTQMTVALAFDDKVTEDEGNNYTDEIIEKMLEIPDIETIGALRSDTSFMMNANENSLSMYLILNEKRTLSNDEIEKLLSSKVEGYPCKATISTSTMDMSALTGSGIEVVIKGEDLDGLQKIALDIEDIFNSTQGVSEVNNGIGKTSQELMISIDKNVAMTYGLTVAQVYQTLSQNLAGDKTATTVTIDKKDYPIIIVKTDKQTVYKDELENIVITGNKNNEEVEVELSEIANINEATSLNSISRESSQRYLSVTAKIDSEYSINQVSKEFENKLSEYEVPDGFDVEITGENETINSTLKDLVLMVAIAVLFIYLVMVAQFQSFRAPFIVMFTIPLAFTGGIFALFITGQDLSVIAMLGFLVLSGIIVNNGIVLIDYINQLIQGGMDKIDAILLAGKTRLRPILMTALTTILGMLTLAFGVGMGADMIQSLGITVIGGLIYSTLLTLVVVPCMYDICYRKLKKNKN